MKDVYTNDKHSFEIVTKIPRGFFVWNIGKHMRSRTLIPLCELKIGGKLYEIEPATLKAIKLPEREAKLIREAAGYSVTSLEAARKYITGEHDTRFNMSALAASVIAIYERITES